MAIGILTRLGIGTKLSAMSGIGVVLVVTLVGATVYGGFISQALTDKADAQVEIGRSITDATLNLREAQMASRDMRLSTTADSADAAFNSEMLELDAMAASLRSVKDKMTLAANIARVGKAEELAKTYASLNGELLTVLKAQIALASQPGADGSALKAQRATIEAQTKEVAADAVSTMNGIVAAAQEIETQAVDAARAQLAQAKITNIVLGVFVLLSLIGSAIFSTKSIAKPIRLITARMSKLAQNDLQSDIPYIGRTDEIGDMAAAVQVFKENAIEIENLNAAETVRSGQTRERAASMTKLMDGLAEAVNAAVDGDFTQRIALTIPDEDLKAVAKNVNDLLSTVDAGISETGQVLAALAQTDLTQRMQGEYRGAFAKLKADTNAVVDNLSDVVGQLRHTSGGLKTATGEILAGANDLAERTTKQAAAIEETSAAMEQLSTTVVENAKRAEQASSKAQIVSDTAALTGEVMTKSNEAMERISTSSSKISNIIGLIDDIAFQTNLLALNASVEAARAGDAGKGFAVVAVEVRRLAQSAASASSEVKVLIEQSAGEVSSGSKLVAEATQKLVDMLGSVKESADLIKDISSASREQSSAITEVSSAIRQMDEMTQHNAALVEETNAAIEQTEGQANELDRIVDRFVVDQHTTRAAAPAALPVSAAPATGIKALQQKVKAAASSYLSKGNTALKEDWTQF